MALLEYYNEYGKVDAKKNTSLINYWSSFGATTSTRVFTGRGEAAVPGAAQSACGDAPGSRPGKGHAGGAGSGMGETETTQIAQFLV